MKESDKIFEKCKRLQLEFEQCYIQAGYKARYLGWCSTEGLKVTKCKMEHFQQVRLEHVEETLRHRRERMEEERQ